MDNEEFSADDSVGFRDLLFNLLLTFLMIIFILIVQVSVQKAVLDDPSRYIITVDWNDDQDVDLDIWTKLGNNILSYSNKKIGPLVLDRDDLGKEFIIIDGEIVDVFLNREVVTIRNKIPEDSELQIDLNSFDFPKSLAGTDIEAVVEVIELNPYRIVDTQTITFTQDNERYIVGIYRVVDGKLTLIGREGESIVHSSVAP